VFYGKRSDLSTLDADNRFRQNGATRSSKEVHVSVARFPAKRTHRHFPRYQRSQKANHRQALENIKLALSQPIPVRGLHFHRLVSDIETALIVKASLATNWNQSRTARALHIERDQLRYRMKKYGIRSRRRLRRGRPPQASPSESSDSEVSFRTNNPATMPAGVFAKALRVNRLFPRCSC
jgi:DNA-binding protein Fis